ncbi:LAFE_0G05512g1_1 [Lachancea fermentati]|uniref:LAFE_0G05512g1_1 n=1 Tax=Lachancea fermentati TaxID=4955 RepID=A0A1G4MHH5_LACFM|nr:LAFE_0G05512g1_1 [Lachancea fermentati]
MLSTVRRIHISSFRLSAKTLAAGTAKAVASGSNIAVHHDIDDTSCSGSRAGTPGNSFSSFKEYREIAKTYGPLSASLATKRNLSRRAVQIK